MSAGRFCHQRPERSFFFKGYQFPICARCTGVLTGNILAGISLMCKFYLPLIFCVIFLFVMGIDWSLQHFFRIYSTNTRRFITGILGGYGLFFIYVNIIKLIF